MGDDFGDLLDTLLGDGASDASAAPASDAIDQFSHGTTTSVDDFVTVGNTCKARNFPALAMVKEFQSQLNRVATAKKLPKVAVDGEVGPATLSLFRAVQAASGGALLGNPATCMGVAPDVDVLGADIKQFADTLGAPVFVTPPISLKAPTVVTKSGLHVVAPNSGIAGSLATLSGPTRIALLAVAGGVGYMLFTGKPKRKEARP
jgi:hypothetical protein